MTEQEERVRWGQQTRDTPWRSGRPGLTVSLGMTLGAAVFALSLAAGSRAHGESTMTPIDRNGRMIDNSPPPPGLTLEERVERLERRSTAHCRSGYHLEATWEGLVCVQRSR
jgi:hypothetical protein